MRRGSQRRVVCGLNTHGCKPVLRNALGLSLEHGSGGVAMPSSKRSQDAPGTPKQVVREGSTLRLRLPVFRMTHGVVRLSAGRLHNTLPFPAAGDG